MLTSKKRPILVAVILLSTLILSHCQPAQNEDKEQASMIQALTDQVEEQEEQIARLEDENQQFSSLVTQKDEQIDAIEDEMRVLLDVVDELEVEIQRITESRSISRAPNNGWEQYFPEANQSTLIGETTDVIEELLGIPPYIIRSTAYNAEFSREIWVYTPYQEDPTGLYLFFQNSELTESRLDEFQGLYGSGLLDLEDFWW